MESKEVVAEILKRSGMSKTQLSSESGISRSLIDGYLKGRSQPSLRQLQRLARAGSQVLSVAIDAVPEIPTDFVAVLEFGEIFPHKDPKPLVNLGPLWRESRSTITKAS